MFLFRNLHFIFKNRQKDREYDPKESFVHNVCEDNLILYKNVIYRSVNWKI